MKYLELKYLELEREIERKEKLLEEYLGLKTEKEIKIEEDLLRLLKRLKLIAWERGNIFGTPPPPILPKYAEDWDFDRNYWTLDTSDYVSPPSSLKFTSYCGCICKVPSTLNIIEGRLVTCLKSSVNWGTIYNTFSIFLRVNDPPGSFDTSRTLISGFGYILYAFYDYTTAVSIEGSKVRLLRSSTTKMENDIINKPENITEWVKWRVTWWTSAGVLIVRHEYFDGVDWIKVADDLVDSSPRVGENYNRCGIGIGYKNPINFDDTEIWSA